jgi:Raf kinase inhibitor-like YbhB/YbcL family protein
MKQEAKTVAHKLLSIRSVFKNNEFIPAKYTCDGSNVNPPLEIENIPKEAKCLAVIVDDPDAPSKTWVHWVCWNIPVTNKIKENEMRGAQGVNDFGKNNYGGPCPPKGTHRYFFKIYALDKELNLEKSTTKTDLEKAMSDHIVAFGDLFGLYIREQ